MVHKNQVLVDGGAAVSCVWDWFDAYFETVTEAGTSVGKQMVAEHIGIFLKKGR